ncbi:hypothetical protein OG21DRAFT_699893 [Imleria badia]|nr:hypothetical protein OG21DRAFT_699893 [Imleria badia]
MRDKQVGDVSEGKGRVRGDGRTRLGRVYRADTVAFGLVEIKTRQDLSRMKSLYLWLDTLLEREDKSNVIMEEAVVPPPSLNTDTEEISDEEIDDNGDEFSDEAADEEFFDANDDFSSHAEPEPPSQPAPAHTVPMDRETRARRLVAHLKQPFGALLLTLASTGGRAVDYRRVAADSVITVQFQESVSLADILDNSSDTTDIVCDHPRS